MVSDIGVAAIRVDCFFEFLEGFVALLIGIYSYKIYKLNAKKKYLYFSLAFFILAISFALGAIINYSSTQEWISAVSPWMKITNIGSIYELAILLYFLFFITGLATLAVVSLDLTKKREVSLIYSLSLIGVALSIHIYQATHFIALLLLIYIMPNFYQNYRKTKSSNALIVFAGFAFLFFSQILFLFAFQVPSFYFTAHIIQLLGFTLLLINFIKVLRS